MNLRIPAPGILQPAFPELMKCMGVDMAAYDWHAARIDAVAWPGGSPEGWISGCDLAAKLAGRSVQFFFAVFDAVPIGYRADLAEAPWADGNDDIWKEDAIPQIPNALFEVIYFDVSEVLLIGITEEQATAVLSTYPSAKISDGS